MHFLVNEALNTAKYSTKNDRVNYDSMRIKYWQLVSQIRRENVTLSPEEKSKLELSMLKMK